MPNVRKKIIIFDRDDWLRGLHPQYGNSLARSILPYGNNTGRAYNPFYRLGYLTPGYYPADYDDGSDITDVQKSGKVYRSGLIATTTGSELVRTDVSGAIPDIDDGTTDGVAWPYDINTGSATCIGEDTATYISNVSGTATDTFFYSWRDTGGSATWNVGRYDGVNGTIDDDFMSTVASGGGDLPTSSGTDVPHPLHVGSDDTLLIGDRNFVHLYDGRVGNDGTFYEEVLTLPRGYVITAFADYGDYVMVFAYKSNAESIGGFSRYVKGEAKAILWDQLSLDPTAVYDLNDNFVSEALSYNGTVVVFTKGRTNDLADPERDCSLQLFDGSKFESVADWIGESPGRGGAFVRDRLVWFLDSTAVWGWGQYINGLDSQLFKLHQLTSGTVSGMLSQPNSLYMVGSNGTASNAWYLNKSKFYRGNIQTAVGLPKFDNEHVGEVTGVKINFAETTGTDVTDFDVLLYNQDGDNLQIMSESSYQITDSNISIKFNNSDFNNFTFTGLYVVIQWTENQSAGNTDTQVVESVEVSYEPINLQNLE